jgi:hypothetical protein
MSVYTSNNVCYIPLYKRAPRLIALFIVCVVVALTGYAIQASVPGDALYALDRGFEAMTRKFYVNKEESVKYQAKRIVERIEELDEIRATTGDQENVNMGLRYLEYDTQALLTYIDESIQSSGESPFLNEMKQVHEEILTITRSLQEGEGGAAVRVEQADELEEFKNIKDFLRQ